MSLARRLWLITLIAMVVLLECGVVGFSTIGLYMFVGRIKSFADAAAVFGPFLSVPLL